VLSAKAVAHESAAKEGDFYQKALEKKPEKIIGLKKRIPTSYYPLARSPAVE